MKRKLDTSRIEAILHRVPVFFNPRTDYGFKKLFGEEANKDLLIDFLNSILPEKHRVKDLSFRNSENLGDTKRERGAFFDISCQTSSGEEIIVEMQRLRIKNYKDRTLLYGSIPIRRQARRGEEWDYDMKAVYVISLLDFEFEESDLKAKVKRLVQLREEDGTLFSDKLNFYYLHLETFDKKANELRNQFDKWMFFLKNLETLHEIPRLLGEPIFKRGFDTARITNMTQQQYIRYEKSWLNYLSNKAAYDTATETGHNKGMALGLEMGIAQGMEKGIAQGIEKGIAEGMEKGIAQGIEKGIEEGMEKGRFEEKIVIAEKSYLKGLTIEVTAEIVELPLEAIRELFAKLDEKRMKISAKEVGFSPKKAIPKPKVSAESKRSKPKSSDKKK